MALTDLFAGTSTLEAHTSDSGHSWDQLASGGGVRTLSVAGGACYCDADAGPRYGVALSSWVPPSADYTVTGVAAVVVDTEWAGVVGRAVGTNQDTDLDGYLLILSAGSNSLVLYRFDNGNLTQIDDHAVALTVGNSYTFSLRFVGTTLSILFDGAEVSSVVDATYTAAGSAGVAVVRPGSGASGDATVLASVVAESGATGYSVTAGPAGMIVGQPSASVTVTADGELTGEVVITLTELGLSGGSFSVPFLTLTNDDRSASFEYDPAEAGAGSIAFANDGGLSDPAPFEFEAYEGVIQSVAGNFPGGPVAAVGYRADLIDGTPFLTRSTAGVTDLGADDWAAAVPLPGDFYGTVYLDDTVRELRAVIDFT